MGDPPDEAQALTADRPFACDSGFRRRVDAHVEAVSLTLSSFVRVDTPKPIEVSVLHLAKRNLTGGIPVVDVGHSRQRELGLAAEVEAGPGEHVHAEQIFWILERTVASKHLDGDQRFRLVGLGAQDREPAKRLVRPAPKAQ